MANSMVFLKSRARQQAERLKRGRRMRYFFFASRVSFCAIWKTLVPVIISLFGDRASSRRLRSQCDWTGFCVRDREDKNFAAPILT